MKMPKMSPEEEIQVVFSAPKTNHSLLAAHTYMHSPPIRMLKLFSLPVQTLHLAQHHLDMMESVMVRVEELMDST